MVVYICIHTHTHDTCTHVYRRTHVFHWNRKGIRRARNSWASLSGSSSICRWTHEVRPCRAGTLYLPASTPPKTQMCTNLWNNPSIFFCSLTGPCSSNLRTSYYARLLCEVRERGLREKDLACENLRRMDWENRLNNVLIYCAFVDYLKGTIICW